MSYSGYSFLNSFVHQRKKQKYDMLLFASEEFKKVGEYEMTNQSFNPIEEIRWGNEPHPLGTGFTHFSNKHFM